MVVALVISGSFILALIIFSAMRFYRNGINKKRAVIKNEEQRSDLSPPDYGVYVMTFTEKTVYIALAAAFLCAVAYVFYQSFIISVLVMPLAVFYPNLKSKQKAAKQRHELNLQFREALYSLASSISAGKSVELAFRDVAKDLAVMYPDPDTPVIREFSAIAGKIEINETIESALVDLARRSHDEDIQNFTDVFITGKRSGGNMKEIIKNTSVIISDKLRIQEEIDTLLAERRLEQRVLNIMPIALVLLLTWSTGDYMTPVFETALGRFIMTVAVLLLALAYVISRKITDIEV